MAVVTHAIATPSTTNASSYASGAFTPAAGDLLVAFVVASGTIAAGSMTDSQGLGWTKIAQSFKGGGVDSLYLFISNALAAASSMMVTFDCTGDAATGAVVSVARVSGVTRTGVSAALQSQESNNVAAGNTPAPTFDVSVLTGNPTLGVVGNGANPAGLTPPTNWTEQNDTGYNNPTTGSEYVSRDSGFTGTTMTWGSSSATAHGAIIVEIDTSAASADPFPAGYKSRKDRIDLNTLLRM